uniref:Uncharacterized protein n=1 Tax=Monopterus albus TaxID=43700 RepID=A0A3Q3QQD6_MONAL
MDIILASLACVLLAISFTTVQGQTNVTTSPGLNFTHVTTVVTSSNSTENPNMTEGTVTFKSTTQNNETTSQSPPSQSTTSVTALTNGTSTTSVTALTNSTSSTTVTALTNSTSVMTTTPGNHTPTFTALTTPAIETTAGYTSTPDTTVITISKSPPTASTSSDSEDRTTQGLGLNISEKNLTIVFSVILGVFAVVLVVFMFHRCKQKVQYLHQPLHNNGDTGRSFPFIIYDDTLVISGGLYDGHPIYDNVPTAPADQSQFRLELSLIRFLPSDQSAPSVGFPNSKAKCSQRTSQHTLFH